MQVACNGLVPAVLALTASALVGGAADLPLQTSSHQGVCHVSVRMHTTLCASGATGSPSALWRDSRCLA